MMDGLTISHVGCLKFRQAWLGDGPYRLWVVGDFWVFFSPNDGGIGCYVGTSCD